MGIEDPMSHAHRLCFVQRYNKKKPMQVNRAFTVCTEIFSPRSTARIQHPTESLWLHSTDSVWAAIV